MATSVSQVRVPDRQPVEHLRVPPPMRRLNFPSAAVHAGVYGLFGLQVYRGLRQPLDAFSQSYWLVNYSQGFVRRGLTGSVLDLLVGRATPGEVDVAACLVVLPGLLGLLLVIRALLRRGSRAHTALAVLITCSPFTVAYLSAQRRPDQLGLGLLLLLGAASRRPGVHRRAWLASIGLGFGALVLVHEGVTLEDLPFAALIAVLFAPPSGSPKQIRRSLGRVCVDLGMLVLPSAVALAGVSLFGSVDPATAAHLRTHAAFAPRGATNGLTMFDFLPQSARSAVSFVVHGHKRDHASMVLLGVVLLAVHWLWTRVWSACRVSSELRRRAGAALTGALTLFLMASAAVLFATGIDWVRWFAALGLGWVVTVALLMLRPVPALPPAAPRLRVATVWIPVYLIAVPLLPTSASAHQAVRLLLLHS